MRWASRTQLLPHTQPPRPARRSPLGHLSELSPPPPREKRRRKKEEKEEETPQPPSPPQPAARRLPTWRRGGAGSCAAEAGGVGRQEPDGGRPQPAEGSPLRGLGEPEEAKEARGDAESPLLGVFEKILSGHDIVTSDIN
ncbi:hypothetical protein LUU34_00044600 [Aix galericulata]|nr:hypothetical protein LUU34_00044600 [Aix galericulata]